MTLCTSAIPVNTTIDNRLTKLMVSCKNLFQLVFTTQSIFRCSILVNKLVKMFVFISMIIKYESLPVCCWLSEGGWGFPAPAWPLGSTFAYQTCGGRGSWTELLSIPGHRWSCSRLRNSPNIWPATPLCPSLSSFFGYNTCNGIKFWKVSRCDSFFGYRTRIMLSDP